MSRLIRNSIRTPDGTVLVSRNTHDCVVHTDANGQMYGVDGGNSYSRRIGNTNECEDLNVWVNEDLMTIGGKNPLQSFEIIRDCIHWGSRGKNGDQPLKHIKLKDMTNEHLDAILNVYTGPVDSFYKKCFKLELEYRERKSISIHD